jgi:hypothetical protein
MPGRYDAPRRRRIGLAADTGVRLQAYAGRPTRNGPGADDPSGGSADDAVVTPTTRTQQEQAMHHFPSNPSVALQLVRVRHAEIGAQAHLQRVRRQSRFNRSRR